MAPVGEVDARGRFELVGAAVTGAAVGALVLTLVSGVVTFPPQLAHALLAPVVLVAAAVGIVVTVSDWRRAGGYAAAAAVRDWITDRRVPPGTPSEVWMPALQQRAEERGRVVGQVVAVGFWLGLYWLQVDRFGIRFTLLLTLAWVAYAVWLVSWKLRRATIARDIVRRGVSTLD